MRRTRERYDRVVCGMPGLLVGRMQEARSTQVIEQIAPRTLGDLGALIVVAQRELMQCLGTPKAEMLRKNIGLWCAEAEGLVTERKD